MTTDQPVIPVPARARTIRPRPELELPPPMDHTGQQRTYPWLLGLAAIMALVGGGLVLGIGRSDTRPGDELPAAPVLGMADPNAAALPAGGRPVLQVTSEGGVAASVSTTSVPGDGGTPTLALGSETTLATVTSAPAPTETSTTVSPETSPSPSDPTSTTAVGQSTTTPPVGAGDLTTVELELARLTNELRTNPNGPLRREGAVIDCDGRVPIDPETGLYEPVAALAVDSTASLLVARDWSSMLTTNLEHRPQAGIAALQSAGIDVAAAGENIAYHNFPDKASRHFVGWRESDGHFCNMMDPTFTHVGVGEVTRSDGFSFATQNFFSLR